MGRANPFRAEKSLIFRLSGIPTAACVALSIFLSGSKDVAAQSNVEKLISQDVSDKVGAQYGNVTEGIKRFANGSVKECYDFMKKAKAKHSKLPPAEILVSRLLIMSNNQNAGRAWLERAVKEDPQDPEAYLMFASNALSSQRWTEALALYEKGLAFSEAYTGNAKRKRRFLIASRKGLSAIAEQHEKYKQAEMHIRKWLSEDDEDVAAHVRLGTALFHQDKDKEAAKELLAANKIDEEKAFPMEIRMGLLYHNRSLKIDKEKSRASAVRFIAAGTKGNPKNLQAHLAAAQWALQINRLDLARKYAEVALAIDSDSLNSLLMRGLVARHANNPKVAESNFEKAHLKSPGNFTASNNLALLLIEQDDKAKQIRALEFAQINSRQYARNSSSRNRFEAVTTLGWVYFKLGQKKQAAQAFQALIQSRVLSADAKYYLAEMLVSEKRDEESVSLLEQSLDDDKPFVHRADAESLLKKIKARIKKP